MFICVIEFVIAQTELKQKLFLALVSVEVLWSSRELKENMSPEILS